MSTFFTIIIPTLNCAGTITSAIESISCQTFDDYEILVMDGGSVDNTLENIRTSDNLKIRIHSDKDSGVYDAMNKGTILADGKWLYFLGADDYLLNEFVLENVFNSIKQEDPDFFYGNVIWGKGNSVYGGPFRIKDLYFLNICHQAIFIKKDLLIDQGLFEVKYLHCADWHLNIKIFGDRAVKVFYSAQVIAYYSLTGMSSIQPIQDDFSRSRLVMIKKYFSWNNRTKLFLSKKLSILSEWLIPSR